ncbi:hypothetical protein [Planococcus wigleyi]|uniref:Uncharacterized protein n=1 Tax=Planococcus wigleyi TaxID=2762216 RepID=A0ABR8WDE0_9BACL|nr:hypothetical protein [Planococcus wigleyi]MBD8015040.1 hypothetical protein [Planococcus wigleyi]
MKDFINICISFIAFLSTRVDLYQVDGKKFSIKVLFINLFISLLLSSLIAFFIATVLIANYDFREEFWSYFIIFLSLFSLMILMNIFSKQINIPKIFLIVVFYIIGLLKSILDAYLLFIMYTAIFAGGCSVLAYTFHQIFTRYGLNNELFSMTMSLIIGVGLTLGAFYGFPASKSQRDQNELLISPVLIIGSILIGYFISETNFISNINEGNGNFSLFILTIFVITAITQISSYFKKIIEKIYEIDKYNERIIQESSIFEEKKNRTINKFFQIIENTKNDIKSTITEFRKDKGNPEIWMNFIKYFFYAVLIVFSAYFLASYVFYVLISLFYGSDY